MVLKKELTMFLNNFSVISVLLLLLLLNPILAAVHMNISSYLAPLSYFSEMSLILSDKTKMFSMVVYFVSCMIYLYSYFYLGMGKDMNTFRSILMVFVFSMIFLIISESFLMYIMGWDGLGVSSFLLVVYYSSLLATRSGLATFITNRIGDFFIIMSFIFLLALDTAQNMNLAKMSSDNFNMFNFMFFLFLLMGAFTKSAQIPFSAWLPAAMAAPTPVSALVHSSTLVTAGLYIISKFVSNMDLVINFSFIFCYLTIFLSALAGMMAVVETDLKKLVAMSTLSQMGLIGYILFLKESNIALFHVFSHASFKSLLFVVVGSFIIFNTGFQDIRVKSMNMNTVKSSLILIILTSMSLMGSMYSSGFFSKDLIILNFSSVGLSPVLYLMLLFSCFMTVCYSLKSFKLLLNNMSLVSMDINKTDSSWLSFCTMGLFLFTMGFGYLFFWEKMDQELYITESMNKTLGIWILVLGAFYTLFFWSKIVSNTKFYTHTMHKSFKIFFMAMVNLNWISNNFFSSCFKNKYINFYEPTWWLYISEVVNNKMHFLQKENNNLKISNIVAPLEQFVFFLLFFINIFIILAIIC